MHDACLEKHSKPFLKGYGGKDIKPEKSIQGGKVIHFDWG